MTPVRTSLVRAAPPRPAIVVTRDGVTVYLSVHDAAHTREATAWAARIVQSHDTGSFRGTVRALAAWLKREWGWYRALQLLPPQAARFMRWVRHTWAVIGERVPIEFRSAQTGLMLPRRPGGRGPRKHQMVVDHAASY